jgi:hydroxyacylglutathione hydrolase
MKVALADSKINLSFYHGASISYKGKNIKVSEENDNIHLYRNLYLSVTETSGHNEGCLCFKLNHFIFTGYSLIIGRKVVTKVKSRIANRT